MPARLGNPPSGLKLGQFTNADEASIRYAEVPPHDPNDVSAVVIDVTGFRESIERYYELMSDQQDRGMAVFAMDWRGQGGSERYWPDKPQRPGSLGYDHDVADLRQFIDEVVRPAERFPGKPVILFAHSMGANISMRFMHDNPDTFDAAVLSPPMLGVQTKGFPRWAAKGLARAMRLVGLGKTYMPGEGDWEPHRELKDLVTDRTVRQELQDRFARQHDDLKLGGATSIWLDEALKSMSVLSAPEYLRGIKTPIQMHSARREFIVDPAAHDHAMKHLPNAEMVRHMDAYHEIWMKPQQRRDRVWDQVDNYLRRIVPGADFSIRQRQAPDAAPQPTRRLEKTNPAP